MIKNTLLENISVGGQVELSDLNDLAEQGFKTIINNRPDHEAAGQPTHHMLEEATKALGLNYVFIPMTGQISPDVISKTQQAFSGHDGPHFAFCASGARSTILWCFAHVHDLGVDGVLAVAGGGGYDLNHLKFALEAYLENQAKS